MKNIEQVYKYVISQLENLNIDFKDVVVNKRFDSKGTEYSVTVYKTEGIEKVLDVKDSELKYLVKRFDFETELVNQKQK